MFGLPVEPGSDDAPADCGTLPAVEVSYDQFALSVGVSVVFFAGHFVLPRWLGVDLD